MAYIINTYNNAQLAVVQDGTIDQTTDLKLVGKNYAGYGEIQNENFVFLLENFAGLTEPPKAIIGQIWFDAANSKLKFYDGFQWRVAGGAFTSHEQPAGLSIGDFWWDTNNEQLYAYNGTEWILIGPQGIGEGVTQFQSREIKDSVSPFPLRPVIVSIVDDEIIHIISSIDFIIHPDEQTNYPGFDKIHQGLTLKNTINSTNGVTSTDHRWWGTATNSDRLAGLTADKFIQIADPSFDFEVSFADAGIKIGNDNDLRIRIVNDNVANFANEQGSEMIFQVLDQNLQIAMPIRFTANQILPGYVSNYFNPNIFSGTRNVDIGADTNRFINVYGNSFKGVADSADLLKGKYIDSNSDPATEYMEANVSHVSNTRTIVVRDHTGTIQGTLFDGTATAAQYADLAENYVSDKDYEPGTVLIIGGTAEVTESNEYCSTKVAGVVSTNPAYLMNKECVGVAVALKGRVPCKVVGKVRKGDFLITSHIPGVATAVDTMTEMPHSACIIGKSLQEKDSNDTDIIEIFV